MWSVFGHCQPFVFADDVDKRINDLEELFLVIGNTEW